MSKRKPYKRELPVDWWLKNAWYTKYMFREGTSVLLTIYSLILAWGLFRLVQGPVQYHGWLESLTSPVAIIFHVITLIGVLYHMITWFDLAPKAADMWMNGKKVADKVLVSGLYIAFAACSLIVFLVFVFA